ncbi:tRNA (adenosine(37)-N6)-dimethylallyltransferase MiaA [Enterococcus sp. LJL128]
MKKVLVIVGPTAVGKTALSIHMAKKFDGEIISGDSMQVYRKLDIGTAKVTKREMEDISHYLIDCRDITDSYSAADFQREARGCIEAINGRGKLPIVVGGTGLYIQSLLYDFQLGGKKEDESLKLREEYNCYAEQNGNEALWQQLQEKDSLAAAAIHFNNRKKVIRALEVFDLTGYSIMRPKEQPQQLYDYFLVGLETERELLYQRINQRVDEMLKQGLLEEAEYTYENLEMQAAQGIGYKEFFPYFQGKISLEEAVEQVKQNSRRYAKRQLTWFRNRMQANWINLIQQPDSLAELDSTIEKWLKQERR